MAEIIDLQVYRVQKEAKEKQEEVDEVEQLKEELDEVIREHIVDEIEHIGFECYDLTDDEKDEIGLDIESSAYYVVVSPWIFYTMDDDDDDYEE